MSACELEQRLLQALRHLGVTQKLNNQELLCWDHLTVDSVGSLHDCDHEINFR